MTSAKNDLTRNAAETRKNYTESIPARIRAAAPDIGTIARTLSGIRETIGTLTDTRGNIDPDALTTAALEQIRAAFINLTDGINNRLFIDRYDREHPEQRKTSPEPRKLFERSQRESRKNKMNKHDVIYDIINLDNGKNKTFR